jgi:hypothetical protein
VTDYTDLIARLRVHYGNKHALEAADALEAQARRIAELEEEWEDLEEKTGDIHLRYYEQIKTLYARIAELEAALKPFDVAYQVYEQSDWPSKADLLERLISSCITVDDLRAASAAYRGEKE